MPYHKQTLRDLTITLVRRERSPPRGNDLSRPPVAATAKNKNKNKGMYPGCLAHVMSGIFRHVLQSRCKPTPTRPTYMYKFGGFFLKIVFLRVRSLNWSGRVLTPFDLLEPDGTERKEAFLDRSSRS